MKCQRWRRSLNDCRRRCQSTKRAISPSGGGVLERQTRACALPLLASSYQFCRVGAKTEDHYFLGFPSYFNVVAFYAIVFELGAGALAAMLVICSLLIFIPIRYIYPTRTI